MAEYLRSEPGEVLESEGDGLTQVSVVDATTARLREMIADGVLKAGQQLRQDELASELGISRTPLREAIARLHAEGLAVIEAYRGATVFRPTAHELGEIYDVRLLLEPRAAELATHHAGPPLLQSLRRIFDELERSSASDFPRMNRRFHQVLYGASGHEKLCDVIAALSYQSEPFVAMLVGGVGSHRAQQDHAALIGAVAAGNGLVASSITYEHLRSTREVVSEMIKEQELRQPSRLP
jgi:DNA-binding GntR family transcriptional regulator